MKTFLVKNLEDFEEIFYEVEEVYWMDGIFNMALEDGSVLYYYPCPGDRIFVTKEKK